MVSNQIDKPCSREGDRPLNESAALPRGRTALEPGTDYYTVIHQLLQHSCWGADWIVAFLHRLPPMVEKATLLTLSSQKESSSTYPPAGALTPAARILSIIATKVACLTPGVAPPRKQVMHSELVVLRSLAAVDARITLALSN